MDEPEITYRYFRLPHQFSHFLSDPRRCDICGMVRGVYDYSPSAPSRFPWPDSGDPTIMPCFYFINQEILRGFGSDTGSVRLAELLLNAGQPGNAETEYVLEGDGGYRGVGYLSAETHLWLPGSAAWDPTQWEPEA